MTKDDPHPINNSLFAKLSSSINKMSLTSKILSGFAVPVVLMVIVSKVVYNSTNALIETSDWVTHTQEVITKGHVLDKLVLDMETGERGFLITGKEEFLEPFINSREQWDKEVQETKLLVSDNPGQVKKVNSINQKAKQWIKLAAEPEIAQRRKVQSSTISLDRIQTLLAQKTGKNILDRIRAQLDEINQIFELEKNQIASNLLVSISKDIVDKETGERGFLITGEEVFLEPYFSGQENLQIHMSELKSLILNSPEKSQVSNLVSKIEELVKKWETEAAIPEINNRREIKNVKQAEAEAEFNSISQVMLTGTGKKILDELRGVLYSLNNLFVRSDNENGQLLVAIISKSIVDRETGQRGFLISGEERFLEPYNEGETVFETNIKLIKQLAENIHDKQKTYQLVEAVEEEIKLWHEKAAEIEIETRREINRTGLSPMEFLQRMQSRGLNDRHLQSFKNTINLIQKSFDNNPNSQAELILSGIKSTLSNLESSYLKFAASGNQQSLDEFNSLREVLTRNIIQLSNYANKSMSGTSLTELDQQVETLIHDSTVWYIESIEPTIHSRKNILQSRASALAQIQQVLKQGKGKKILDEIRVLLTNVNQKAVKEKNTKASNLILQISKAVVDQETGERGFIITGEETFLEPYHLGSSNLSRSIAELKNIVDQAFDIKVAIAKFSKIESEIRRWQTVAAEPEIELRRRVNIGQEKYSAIIDATNTGSGKTILDNIRYLQNDLNQDFIKASHITAQRLIVSIAKDIVDMETGQRGFLLTGREEYLQPYDRGIENLKKHSTEIRNIINASFDIAEMQQDIEKVRVKTELWKSEVGEPEIALRRKLDETGATMQDVTRIIESGTGKRLIEALHKEIFEFIQVEKDLIKVRTLDSQKAVSNTLYLTIFGTLAAAIIAFLTAFFLLRAIVGALSYMSEATKKVAEGDYQSRIAINSKDQIGELANSFNTMTDRLERTILEMRQSRNDLESQTELLAEKNIKLLQSEDELKQKADELEQTSEYKSHFLATMSHEIRTPMNGVLGMLGLLQNTELTSEQNKKVQVAKSSADSLLTIINEILDFSKIESGKLELEFIDFNLRGMLGDFSESMAMRAQEKGLEIVLDVTKIEQSMVVGDSGRIRQILVNLVGNAIKFTQNGEIVIHAEVIANGGEQLIFKCSIEDTGIGISQDKIDKLFEVFTQADSSTTREYGGTGLGLSISKRLCELMNGSIEVSSTLGHGSKFEFCLNLEKSQRSELVIPQVDISKLHLLVVDDNATNRDVLRGQLEHWGAKVSEADSAKQALYLCQKLVESEQKLFDVAYLDMQMPVTNGAQLAQMIRNNKQFDSMKMVMMTSISHSDGPQYFADLGFSAFFPKPTTTSDIFDSLNIVVDGGEALTQAGSLITHNYLGSLKHKTKFSEHNGEQKNIIWPEDVRLLLVEDNHVNQQVAVGILDEIGLNCDVAANGIEALRMLKVSLPDNPYSLILMDCQMPEMDGYQASSLIRQGKAENYYKQIPIIAMTANAMEGDREKCLDAGMSDYLAKPVEPETIREKLVHWLLQQKSNVSPIRPVQESVSLAKETSDGDIIWDKEAMSKRLMKNDKLMNKLISSFLQEMPARVTELESEEILTKPDELGNLAHTIKGVASNLSALKLSDKASALEAACNNDSGGEYSSMVDEMLTSYAEVKTVFEKFQAENNADVN